MSDDRDQVARIEFRSGATFHDASNMIHALREQGYEIDGDDQAVTTGAAGVYRDD